MRLLIGLPCLAIAAGFVVHALRHKRQVAAARALLPPDAPTEDRLTAMGEIARPLIIAALVYTGLKTSLVFYAVGAAETLSYLDLAGFLALLAAYGFWFTARTKHRLPHPAAEENATHGGLLRPDRDLPRLRRGAGPRPARADLRAPLPRAGPGRAAG